MAVSISKSRGFSQNAHAMPSALGFDVCEAGWKAIFDPAKLSHLSIEPALHALPDSFEQADLTFTEHALQLISIGESIEN